MVQRLNGPTLQRLTQFSDGRKIDAFAWSRDGRGLAIARSTTTNDIVLFKGLRAAGRCQIQRIILPNAAHLRMSRAGGYQFVAFAHSDDRSRF